MNCCRDTRSPMTCWARRVCSGSPKKALLERALGAEVSEHLGYEAQRNFTDPESRILKTKDGYIQGYNAQAAVDARAQIIVAHDLTPSTSDQDQLVALVDGIERHLGRRPKQASADAGYCSEANLAALAERQISAYIATGRAKHPGDAKRKIAGPLTKAMRD